MSGPLTPLAKPVIRVAQTPGSAGSTPSTGNPTHLTAPSTTHGAPSSFQAAVPAAPTTRIPLNPLLTGAIPEPTFGVPVTAAESPLVEDFLKLGFERLAIEGPNGASILFNPKFILTVAPDNSIQIWKSDSTSSQLSTEDQLTSAGFERLSENHYQLPSSDGGTQWAFIREGKVLGVFSQPPAPKTTDNGFVVNGANPTPAIRKLKMLDGTSIDAWETRLMLRGIANTMGTNNVEVDAQGQSHFQMAQWLELFLLLDTNHSTIGGISFIAKRVKTKSNGSNTNMLQEIRLTNLNNNRYIDYSDESVELICAYGLYVRAPMQDDPDLPVPFRWIKTKSIFDVLTFLSKRA